jgi:molecular chaperone GrpE
MVDPFEVTESEQIQVKSQAENKLDELSSKGDQSVIEDIGVRAIREAVAEIVRQRSDLVVQLEDFQEDALREKRKFFLKLLNIIDSLDRLLLMLDSSNESVETINAVRTQFLQALEGVGVYPIELNLGSPFDVNTCEVSSRKQRDDLAPGTIIMLERRGYMWADKVLRHARVSIATNSEGG